MKQLFVALLCGVMLSINAKTPYLNLQAFRQEQYQDIIINGKVVSKGKRSCQSRYEALRQVAAQYNRPFTVLDIGASQGYFSLRLAEEFDATCIMIEGGYNDNWKIGDQLLDICKLNTDRDSLIFLKHRITLKQLQELAACEHFDVVLVFNVIHHFRDPWKAVTDAFLSLGDNVIIETPPANDSIAKNNKKIGEIERYLIGKKGKVIAETQRHTSNTKAKMFWFEQSKAFLKKNAWGDPNLAISRHIISSYDDKKIWDDVSQSYVPYYCGIKLSTFKPLHGAYPLPAYLSKLIEAAQLDNERVIVKGLSIDAWNLV